MTTYTLKLVSGVDYNLYNGTTLVTDADLATLFGTESEAYFVFDFNSGTPTNTTSLNIVNSNSEVVMANTGLTGIAENKNFKGTWGDSATAFTTFALLPAYGLDEAQLGKIAEKISSSNTVHKLSSISDTAHFWLTPEGTYVNDADYAIYIKPHSNGGLFIYPGSIVVVTKQPTSIYKTIFMTNAIASPQSATSAWIDGYTVNVNTGALSRHIKLSPVYDGLNQTYTDVPLSANQGKVLADRIGTLSNLTTTVKTNIVAAINELAGLKTLTGASAPTTATVGKVGQLYLDTTESDVYICTDATNPYVWEEIGAGGGGIQNALIIREWS